MHQTFTPQVGKVRVDWSKLEASEEALAKLRALRGSVAMARVQEAKAAVARFTDFVNDPVGFVETSCGGFCWSKQKEVMLSVRDNRRTAVPSCHDVGKSAIAARIAAWWLATNEPGEAFVVTTAPTWRQVKNILWREIGRLHRKAGLPGRVTQTEWHINDEIVAFGVSPADNDPTAMQGIHARKVLVILDEACGVVKVLIQAADSLISNDESRMLAIGNPDDPTAEFANMCKPGSGWNVVHISAFDSPNFTGEDIPDWLKPLLVSRTWVEEKRRSWGEQSPLWKSKILGEFPDQAEDGVVPYSALRAAVIRELQEEGDIELGVDVARFGTDNSVCYRRRGRVARKQWKVNGNSTDVVGEKVILTAIELKAKRIKIDDTGIGGGVTDYLNKAKRDGVVIDGKIVKLPDDVEVVPIIFGEAPATSSAGEKFLNLRAELHWGMRLRFLDGDIDIEDDDDLLAQASSIKYRQNSRSQIVIESKDDIKKRGLPSPDDWEALLLAFAKPTVTGSGFLDYYKDLSKTPAPKQ